MISKTGHYQNVTNFSKMVTICKSYQTQYNPPNVGVIGINALLDYETKANAILKELDDWEKDYAFKTNEREKAYEGLRKLSTRILFSAKSTGMLSQHIDDIASINRRIQGRKSPEILAASAVEKKQAKLLSTVDENMQKVSKRINSLQMSYDRLKDNFEKLIAILKTFTDYNPNETDLKITALEDKLEILAQSNLAVLSALVALNAGRNKRNDFLYLQNNNLHATAMSVKYYTRSVFGFKSAFNQQLVSLKFTRFKS